MASIKQRAAADRPLSVLVVSSGWPTPDRPEWSIFVDQEVRFLRRRGVDVEVISYEGRRNPLNYLRARRAVRHELRGRRYDIVHAHFGQTALVVRGVDVPLAITFHGSDLLGVIGARGRNTVRGRLQRVVSRSGAATADRVIVAGQRLADELPRGTAYTVIPAGVDPLVFVPGPKADARSALGLPPDRCLVLFSGSPAVVRKRYALAAEAVGLLGPEMDVELLTVGGLPRETVATYMRACDALVVTSIHESGPLMVKEALACNLRVVSLDVGDVRVLIDGLSGCEVCDDERSETIAAALRRSLLTEGAFDGRSAVRDVLQDRLTERLVELYEEMVEQASRARDGGAS